MTSTRTNVRRASKRLGTAAAALATIGRLCLRSVQNDDIAFPPNR